MAIYNILLIDVIQYGSLIEIYNIYNTIVRPVIGDKYYTNEMIIIQIIILCTIHNIVR